VVNETKESINRFNGFLFTILQNILEIFKKRRRKMNEKLRKEIFNYFKQKNIIYLATSKEDKPAVRPVTLIYFEDEFFLQQVEKMRN